MNFPNLRLLAIKKLIIHDVPKHKKNDFSSEPFLSQKESTISTALLLFFKNKIIDALESERAFKVSYNDAATSPSPSLFKDILQGPSGFIQKTQEITRHIFNIQTGVNPGGIMVFYYGSLDNKPIIGLLKLERDSGAQMLANNKTHSIDAEAVQNLMLTEKTRLFKAALFFSKDVFKVHYDGLIMDFQHNKSTNTLFADFFILNFLGCMIYEDPKVSTKAFFDTTKDFIMKIEDPLKKTKYLQDLFSYVQKNSAVLSPREFATDYFNKANEGDKYKNYFNENNIPFTQTKKDIAYIENKIRKISIEFENGINLIATDGDISHNVKLAKLDGGKYKAEIISKIISVS